MPAGASRTPLKCVAMTERKEKASRPVAKPSRLPDAAFDIWLKRGLHQLFDDVANEPIPAELLRLIEEDRNK